MTPNNQSFDLRPVTLDDAGAIAEIYNYYVLNTTVSFELTPLTVATMRDNVEAISSSYPYFVAVSGDKVIGYCCAHRWKPRPAYCHTFEVTIYLAPNCRRGGVGTALMQRLIAACRDIKDCHALIACITAENEESKAFHTKMGFTQVSQFTQVGYKFGRWIGVLDMEMLL